MMIPRLPLAQRAPLVNRIDVGRNEESGLP